MLMNMQDIERKGPPEAPQGPGDGPGNGVPPGIAVVIPHYNDTERLSRCLAVICAGDLTGVEVVVADNGSTQPLAGIQAAFPMVRFVTEARKGAAWARNTGVLATTAPILAFIDSDCRPAADWLTQARQAGARRDADLFGGRVDVFDETPPPRSGAEAFEAVFAFDWKGYIERQGFAVTANLVTRREVFDSIGGFRGPVTEDMDFCFRARDKGWRLMAVPEMAVGHPSRSDWPALERKWRRTTSENWELGGRRRLAWSLKALAMPVSALAHLPRIVKSPHLNGAGERLAAAGTLLRLRFLRMTWMLRQAAGGSV